MRDVTEQTLHKVRRADVCAVAIADCFRGDGEILANPIGNLPVLGGRLARAVHEPQLMMTDGEAYLTGDVPPLGTAPEVIEGWNPFRRMFDVVWGGRRHVMMGASQIDKYGNQNIAAIGSDPDKPVRQLIGFRGAPGNTINNTTSYWIPNHSTRVFVEKVDLVCGIGYDRAAELGEVARFHNLRHVITNLAVLDFETPDHRMRLRSVHPGVTVEDVVANTGFELVIPDQVPTTRTPTDEEMAVIERLDPAGLRYREVKD